MAPGSDGLLRRRLRRAVRRARTWLERRRSGRSSVIREWGGVIGGGAAPPVDRLRRQLASGVPHETDFRFFASLDGVEGLFVDVGANEGQSAASVRCVNRSLEILSFEPNPLLEPALRTVREELLSGFDYRMVGLSDRPSTAVLYVPVIDGLLVTPLATLDRSLFERPHFHEQLERLARRRRYDIEEITVKLERFDDLGLAPAVVKIDTEEHEVRCLAGMMASIESSMPLFMIERNDRSGEVAAALAPHGYRQFAYDPDVDRLVPLGSSEPVNIFYLNPDHHAVP